MPEVQIPSSEPYATESTFELDVYPSSPDHHGHPLSRPGDIPPPKNLQGISNYNFGGGADGLSAYALNALIHTLQNGIHAKLKNVCPNSSHLKQFNEDCQKLIEYITKHQDRGYLGFNKQLECEKIYYKLADLADVAKGLDHKLAGVTPSHAATELKRLFYTESARFMTTAALERMKINESTQRAELPGEGQSWALNASFGGGAKFGAEGVGVCAVGGVGVGIGSLTAIRLDDHGKLSSDSKSIEVYGTVKAGVGIPNLPVQPTSYGDSKLNIAGSSLNANLTLARKSGSYYLVGNDNLLKLNSFIAGTDLSDSNITKSNRLLNTFRDLCYSSEAQSLGFTNSFYKDWTVKEKGSMDDFMRSLHQDIGMDAKGLEDIRSSYAQWGNESPEHSQITEKQEDTYRQFIDKGAKNLAPSPWISTYTGWSVAGSATASAGIAGDHLVTKVAISHERSYWNHFKLHSSNIDLAHESATFMEMHQKYPQATYAEHATEAGPAIQNFFQENPPTGNLSEAEYQVRINRFLDGYNQNYLIGLSTDISSLSKEILRLNSKAGNHLEAVRRTDELWAKLRQKHVISKDQFRDEHLKSEIFKNPDDLKILIANSVLARHAALYNKLSDHLAPLEDDSKPSPANQTEKNTLIRKLANDHLSASYSYFLSRLWAGSTEAHPGGRQKYRELMYYPGPSKDNMWSNNQTALSWQIGVNMPLGKDVLGDKHQLSIGALEFKASLEKTAFHPNNLRNKDDVTLSITGSGLVPTLIALARNVAGHLRNRSVVQNATSDLPKSSKPSEGTSASEDDPAVQEFQEVLAKSLSLPDNLVPELNKPEVVKKFATAILSAHAVLGQDQITTSNGTNVSPGVGSNPSFGGNFTVNINYNFSTGEIEYVSITQKNALGLNVSSTAVPSLPFTADFAVSYTATDTKTLMYRLYGTSALVSFAQNRLALQNLKLDTVYSPDPHAPDPDAAINQFLKKAIKDELVAGMSEYASKAYDIKTNPTDTRFDNMKSYAGDQGPMLVEKFRNTFNNDDITLETVQNYASAIEKLRNAKTYVQKPFDLLLLEEKEALMKVLSTWQKALAVYANINAATRDHIGIAVHADERTEKVMKLAATRH